MLPLPAHLSKDDPRYLKWRASLFGRKPWNKGLNKNNNKTVKKISLTLTGRSRKKMQDKVGTLKLLPSLDLAELIGIILGDGHLRKCERTEQLCVSCNSNQQVYIENITALMNRVLSKAPSIYRSKSENVVRIVVYQNRLSAKLKLPHGNKIKNNIGIPQWIKSDQAYSIRCLKGLFETDGSLNIHKESYTTVIEFKNKCSQF